MKRLARIRITKIRMSLSCIDGLVGLKNKLYVVLNMQRQYYSITMPCYLFRMVARSRDNEIICTPPPNGSSSGSSSCSVVSRLSSTALELMLALPSIELQPDDSGGVVFVSASPAGIAPAVTGSI